MSPKPLAILKRYCINKLGKDNECEVCESTKRIIIHHVKYFSYSVTYNQFPNTYDGRIQYYAKLLDEIESDCYFNILCMKCHKDLHYLLTLEYNVAISLVHKTNDSYPQGMESVYYENVRFKQN